MNIKEAHKGDYGIYLREVDVDYDQDAGYEVAVCKEGFPPHSVEFFASRKQAEAAFQQCVENLG